MRRAIARSLGERVPLRRVPANRLCNFNVNNNFAVRSASTDSSNSSSSALVPKQLKSGDIYLHRELGYRGIVLYPFTSKSTYYEDSNGKVKETSEQMYVTILLSDLHSRSHIANYLTIMMVHHDGQFNSSIDLEGNDVDQLAKSKNIVRMPLPGFDVVNHLDMTPLQTPAQAVADAGIASPYLELFFSDKVPFVPKEKIMDAWKATYDMHNESYTLRYCFEDDKLNVELFIYPYDVFTRCDDRSKHVNKCFRYRLNVSTDGLDEMPDASLVIGPVLWRIRGEQNTKPESSEQLPKNKAEQKEQFESNNAKLDSKYVFFTRSDYHNPIQLTTRRRSAQFNGDLFLPKRLDTFQVTPLLVCRFLGVEPPKTSAGETTTVPEGAMPGDTRTFQYPAFELKMTKD